MRAPVAMMQAPGDTSRWFVIEQQGIVRVFPNIANVVNIDVSDFVDISDRVLSGGELGLLGMAFHPDFNNGIFEIFVSYTRNNSGQLESVVSRFRSNDNGLTLDDTVEDIILAIPQDNTNHNGGQIAFGADGFLYAGWGDGGGAGDPFERAQDNNYLLGTFTRSDVDGGVPYAIPAGNPSPAAMSTGDLLFRNYRALIYAEILFRAESGQYRRTVSKAQQVRNCSIRTSASRPSRKTMMENCT